VRTSRGESQPKPKKLKGNKHYFLKEKGEKEGVKKAIIEVELIRPPPGEKRE